MVGNKIEKNDTIYNNKNPQMPRNNLITWSPLHWKTQISAENKWRTYSMERYTMFINGKIL